MTKRKAQAHLVQPLDGARPTFCRAHELRDFCPQRCPICRAWWHGDEPCPPPADPPPPGTTWENV